MFMTLVLGVALVFAWRAISDLRRRIGELEASERKADPVALTDLFRRVTQLETTLTQPRAAAVPGERADAPASLPAVAPARPSAPTTVPPRVPAMPAMPAVPATAPVPAAAPVPPAAPPSVSVRPRTAVPTGTAVPSGPAVPPSAAVPPSTAVPPGAVAPPAARIRPPAEPPPSPPAASDSATWEVVVGTSWLNKIGVLVFVIGVALLVGYSFTHIGPIGRVAMGFALSLAMLAGGVVIERREPYRAFAYGLIAGGWAGVYFTTYAMHAVPAARLIESDLVGGAILLAVAAGMIAHSLKYRSQTVTALAYIVAYATLALTPQTGFSLVASIPLALSLLAVATRLQWPGVAVLGVVSTYGLFVLRAAIFPVEAAQPFSVLPLLTVGVYWLMFEVADILASRARGGAGDVSLSLFPLNAVGLIGASSLQLPVNDSATMAIFTAAASAAYLVSAVIRARLQPPVAVGAGVSTSFRTMHAAVAMAAGLALWSIALRFSGNTQTLALLTEAELLIVAGIAVRDRTLRAIGGVVLVIAFGHAAAWAGITAVFGTSGTSLLAPTTPIAILAALACYVNREVLRSRSLTPALIEYLYTWMAFVLVSLVLLHEVPAEYLMLAAALTAVVLLEVGLWRAAEYRHQAYLAGLFTAAGVFWRYLLRTNLHLFDQTGQPQSPAAILVLALVTGLAYTAWYRLSRAARHGQTGELTTAAAIAGGLGTFTLTLLPWYILPPVAVAPAWALLGCASVALGAAYRQSGARWGGYVLVALASGRALLPLTISAPGANTETLAMAIVITALYVVGYLGRRAAIAEGQEGTPALERLIAATIGIGATAAFAVFKWRVLPPIAVAPAWAATAIVLVALGLARERAGQRWQGYALAVVGGMSAFGSLADGAPAVFADFWSPLSVCVLIYLAAALGRGHLVALRRDPAALPDTEQLALRLLPVAATGVLAAAEWRAVDATHLGGVWALTSAVLLLVGLRPRASDLRWHAYVLVLAAAFWTAGLILPVASATGALIAMTAVVIGLMYAMSLAARRPPTAGEGTVADGAEAVVRVTISISATLLLLATILNEARPTMVTLGWGLQGLALMVTGFAARERVLRLSGLGVLLLCILKLFLSDLRGLDPLARIMSFVVLGLVLLAVSWAYTRFQEQIRKFL